MSKSANKKNIINRVSILRKEKGITQEKFAEIIGVTPVTISKIENGAQLSPDIAIKISKQFNVSLDWLYCICDDKGDTASNIIDNLYDVFRIDFKNRTISVDEDLAEFLDELLNAYEVKEKNGIPDNSFKYWINGIKNEYNEKIKNRDMFDTTKIIPKYHLEDYRKHKEESAATIPF